MKISKVRTFVHSDFPNVFHVEVETDSGIVGLGESYYFASSLAHFAEEFAAPQILGKDPSNREDISKALTTYIGYNGSGVETRTRSAIDIALWDIESKVRNLPLYQALGGTTQRELKIYNTCAGKEYMRRSNQSSKSWGIDNESSNLEDLRAFMSDAGNLAEELLSENITAMKIWPFDIYAEKNWGREISNADLDSGLEPIRKIRNSVGNKVDVMIELHGLWSPSAALKIMKALQEFDVFWVEDPLYPDLLEELEMLRGEAMPKIAHGETVASERRVKTLTSRKLIDFLTLDLSWCGGITAGLRLAQHARENGVQIAPHDCTGPVGLLAGAHLSTADSNAVIQETVRSALRTWYPYLVDGLPTVENGSMRVTDMPGHGLTLREDFKNSSGMKIKEISQ
jgi:L-alanine-DL-glutamate epimerase-like enolase superfamily enzyme